MDAWPAESTNRSRFSHAGSPGLNHRNRSKSVCTTGAMAMGVPGWPEFAFCTASIDSVRMVLMQSWSRSLSDGLNVASRGFAPSIENVDAFGEPGLVMSLHV